MHFNRHPELSGKHAFLSPSNYHWLNYSPQKIEARYFTARAAQRGSDLHALACEAIRLGVPLDVEENKALGYYVNDCIAWGMVPEQALYYSDNAFGTADAIRFDPSFFDIDTGLLRISDLKTGISPSSPVQLECYAALFCLEYGVDPYRVRFQLRIYQRDEVLLFEPPSAGIEAIMNKYIEFNQQIELLKEAAAWS